MELKRARHSGLTVIDASAALSAAVDFRKFISGVYHMPGTWTAAHMGFQVCQTKAGTYLPLYDKVGALVDTTTTAVDIALTLPPQLAGCAWFKFWSQNGSAVDVNQVAAAPIDYDLKG